MKPLVYVAGPYQYPDPVQNTRAAILAAEDVVAAGGSPYVPHLTLLWDLVVPHPHEFWMEHDAEWLVTCDALYRIAGASAGADREMKIAAENGMDVFTDLGHLKEWIDAWQAQWGAEATGPVP